MYSRANEKDQHEQDSIDSQLSHIRGFIENEIANKQSMIVRLEEQLQETNLLTLQKDAQLEVLQEKLADCKQTLEGQRQLINKLLNDIGTYQKDIVWYKRTYEQRSLLGLLKDKFLGRPSSKDPKNND